MIRNGDSYSAIIDLLSVRAKACWGQNEEETMAGNYNKIVTLPQRVELQRKGRAETSRPLYILLYDMMAVGNLGCAHLPDHQRKFQL